MPIASNRRVFVGGGIGARGIKFNPTSNCVLWLPGQDDPKSATIKDKSGKGNHGTITGAIWTKLPKGLWGLNFDGTDDFINCGQSASLNLTTTFTLEIWVKTTDTSGELFSKGDESASGYHLRVTGAGPGLGYYLGVDGLIDAGGVVGNNIWHHVRFTYDSGANPKVNVYVDDVNIHTGNETANAAAASNLLIGKHWDGGVVLSGLLALARVYNAVAPSHYQQERHLFGV